MSKNDVELSMLPDWDSKERLPTFVAAVGEAPTRRIITRQYQAHKVLTDASTGKVVEHCFLVRESEETQEVDHDRDEAFIKGETWAVYFIPLNGQARRELWGDYAILNNAEFAYVFFTQAFGWAMSYLATKIPDASSKITVRDTF